MRHIEQPVKRGVDADRGRQHRFVNKISYGFDDLFFVYVVTGNHRSRRIERKETDKYREPTQYDLFNSGKRS